MIMMIMMIMMIFCYFDTHGVDACFAWRTTYTRQAYLLSLPQSIAHFLSSTGHYGDDDKIPHFLDFDAFESINQYCEHLQQHVG